MEIQDVSLLEICDRLFDVSPIRVLGEDGSDTDFKRCFTRPPTLMAIALPKQGVDLHEGSGRVKGWHNALESSRFLTSSGEMGLEGPLSERRLSIPSLIHCPFVSSAFLSTVVAVLGATG